MTALAYGGAKSLNLTMANVEQVADNMEKLQVRDLIEERICNLLKSKGPMRAANIAEDLLGKGAKKEAINPILYRMKKDGILLSETKEGSKAPVWSCSDKPNTKIELLGRLRADAGMGTRDLARLLSMDKSKVNSALYALAKEGKVRKEADPDGRNPTWFLAEDEAEASE